MLDYLQKNATNTKELEDGKFTIYSLPEMVAIYNNNNNKYVWMLRSGPN